jgi:multiple sugar transport system substrate-binding protein
MEPEMVLIDTMNARTTRRGFLAGTAVVAGGLLSACGSSGGPASAGSKAGVTWGSWASPGEAEIFRRFSAGYTEQYGTRVTFQPVVGDYSAKLTTQFAGGTAPDCFYVGDSMMSKLIDSNMVYDISDFLASAESPVKESDFYPGLLPWLQRDGALYGVPNDCNPNSFWFNKDILAAAGVEQNPAEMQEAGMWDQPALDSLISQVKKTGKTPMMVDASWYNLCSWITALGGKAIDDEGRAVFDTDTKALSVIEWIWDHLDAGNIRYAGSLPEGQDPAALFFAGEVATHQFGRAIFPNLAKVKFGYDVAPFPSESGGDIAPVANYTSAMAVNPKSKNLEEALLFMARFVSVEGQRSRLAGNGNAVPSRSGLDDVVTEGGKPEHAAWFTEIAANAYAIPQVLVDNPAVMAEFGTKLDELYKSKPDYKTFASTAAALMNGTA